MTNLRARLAEVLATAPMEGSLVNLHDPDVKGGRILGIRVPPGAMLLGQYGLTEPLDWLLKVLHERENFLVDPALARALEDAENAADLIRELQAEVAARKDWICPETYALTLQAVGVEAAAKAKAEARLAAIGAYDTAAWLSLDGEYAITSAPDEYYCIELIARPAKE
jgi:hypothetical protein